MTLIVELCCMSNLVIIIVIGRKHSWTPYIHTVHNSSIDSFKSKLNNLELNVSGKASYNKKIYIKTKNLFLIFFNICIPLRVGVFIVTGWMFIWYLYLGIFVLINRCKLSITEIL